MLRSYCELLCNPRLDHYGAGITFFAYHPDSLQRMYLLGCEKWGRDEGTYSDFGGARKDTIIESPFDTAAREAAEETCEIFGNASYLKNYLLGLDYQFRKYGTPYPVIVKPSYDRKRCYICFFIEICYEELRALNIRLLDAQQQRKQEKKQQNRDYYEKSTLYWFTDQELVWMRRPKSGQKYKLRGAYATHVHHFASLFVTKSPDRMLLESEITIDDVDHEGVGE